MIFLIIQYGFGEIFWPYSNFLSPVVKFVIFCLPLLEDVEVVTSYKFFFFLPYQYVTGGLSFPFNYQLLKILPTLA